MSVQACSKVLRKTSSRAYCSASSVWVQRLARSYGRDCADPLRRAETELGWLRRAARRLDPVKEEQTVSEWVEDHVVHHKPLAYIIGDMPFGNLDLAIRPPVLIPRPETESWSLRLSSCLPSPFHALDIGTGSGCIGLTLASSGALVKVTAVDSDPAAVSLAKENAVRNRLQDRVSVIEADLWQDSFASSLSRDGFDLVVSNPPYICRSEYDSLEPSVRLWESPLALLGDGASTTDGLAFYRRIVSLLSSSAIPLRPRLPGSPPRLALEVGMGQARPVAELVRGAAIVGIEAVEVWEDDAGVDRVVVGR